MCNFTLKIVTLVDYIKDWNVISELNKNMLCQVHYLRYVPHENNWNHLPGLYMHNKAQNIRTQIYKLHIPMGFKHS